VLGAFGTESFRGSPYALSEEAGVPLRRFSFQSHSGRPDQGEWDIPSVHLRWAYLRSSAGQLETQLLCNACEPPGTCPSG
jgi:hypothetical protein